MRLSPAITAIDSATEERKNVDLSRSREKTASAASVAGMRPWSRSVITAGSTRRSSVSTVGTTVSRARSNSSSSSHLSAWIAHAQPPA